MNQEKDASSSPFWKIEVGPDGSRSIQIPRVKGATSDDSGVVVVLPDDEKFKVPNDIRKIDIGESYGDVKLYTNPSAGSPSTLVLIGAVYPKQRQR